MEDINNTELPPVQTSPESQLPPVQPQTETQTNQPVDTPFVSHPIQEPVNQNEKKTGIGFYIISIIVILFLSSACYVLAFRSKDVLNLITPKNTDNPIPPISQITPTTIPTDVVVKNLKKLSPKETYSILKAEEDKLITFDDYLTFFRKHGSKAKIAEFEEALKSDSTSPMLKEFVISIIKTGAKLKDITDIKETINSNKAILDVSTNKLGQKGMIFFVLEEEIWKLESESWKETDTENVTEIECKSKGGNWTPFRSGNGSHCILKYADAGKLCHSSEECIGDCLLKLDPLTKKLKTEEGYCEEDNYKLGCLTRIEEPTATLCFD